MSTPKVFLKKPGIYSQYDPEVLSNKLNTMIEVRTTAPTASSSGYAGQIVITSDAMYVCVATDTWKKVSDLTSL